QLNAALDLNLKSFSPKNTKWLKQLLVENGGVITYQALGKFEYERFTKKFPKWPYVDKGQKVRVSEALLLHRDKEFHADFNPR
ncbi:hypothetical protein, partial [Zoogloea sp. LCSB751]